MSESLTPDVLAGVLRDLAVSRKEGVLRVQRDGVARAIFFKDGHIVRVDSVSPSESLAETVERAGKVKRVDLELATTVMKQTGESLGKTLAEMGLIAPGDVAAIERERAQSILRSLFAETGGAFRFDERALAMTADETALRLSVDQVVPKAAMAPQPSGASSPPPVSAAKASPPPPRPRSSVKSRNVRPARVANKRTRGGGVRLLLAAAVLGVAVFGSILFIRGRANDGDASTRNGAAAAGGLETSAAQESADAVDRVSEGPTDAELFSEAALAFARDDLEGSKATLETLLDRSPDFAGARELLDRVEKRLANPTPEPVAKAAPPPSAEVASAPQSEPEPAAQNEPLDNPDPPSSDAQLLGEARLAYERGEFAASRQTLDALLSTDPSHAEARQLLAAVDDAIWQSGLPLSFGAAHNHRFGECNGTLSLEPWGMSFTSEDHAWQWAFGDMVSLERGDRWVLNLKTQESDRLNLGGGKNYKFQLTHPIPVDDWARFQRLARR